MGDRPCAWWCCLQTVVHPAATYPNRGLVADRPGVCRKQPINHARLRRRGSKNAPKRQTNHRPTCLNLHFGSVFKFFFFSLLLSHAACGRKQQAEGNLRWSCDHCTSRRKDCGGATPCDRCRRLSLTCARTLPARELRARVSYDGRGEHPRRERKTERQRDMKRRGFRGRLGDWMQAVCTVLRVFFVGCLDRESLCLAHTHARDIVQSLALLLPEHRCGRKTGVRPD